MIFLNDNKRNEKHSTPLNKRVENIISMQNVKTDPNGSYTGVPENPYEQPVQDADDL